MLSVDQALELIFRQSRPLAPRRVGLPDALGLVLAEEIVSDIDSPPHDKSVVDGYAVQAAAVKVAGTKLSILEEVTAGRLPTLAVSATTATRIMTGAPLPAGADAIVMIEKTEFASGQESLVCINEFPVKLGQNIMRQGTSMRQGEIVLSSRCPAGASTTLRAIEIGLLAEVGRQEVLVHPCPQVAVLATGDELVDAAQIPGPAQIRNSNGPMIAAQVRQAGGIPRELGIARDSQADLKKCIQSGLESDVLILSGGVSAGVLDLVPQVLESLGVEQVFHKVNLKPGKPLWFGVQTNANGRRVLVFGLPGNPVSSLVCFELFIRPALAALAGRPFCGLPIQSGLLTKEQRQRGDRPTYWPASCLLDGTGATVTPLEWRGSGDLHSLARANCLAYFPAEDRVFAAGEKVSVYLLE